MVLMVNKLHFSHCRICLNSHSLILKMFFLQVCGEQSQAHITSPSKLPTLAYWLCAPRKWDTHSIGSSQCTDWPCEHSIGFNWSLNSAQVKCKVKEERNVKNAGEWRERERERIEEMNRVCFVWTWHGFSHLLWQFYSTGQKHLFRLCCSPLENDW